MPRSKRTLPLLLLAGFVALTLAAAPSLAVVTYGLRTNPLDPYTAGMDTWPFTTLGNYYYGMNWDYNYQTRGGTSVAIGYFTLLTADHYSIAVGYEFMVNVDKFRVASMETLPADPGQGTNAPDLLVLHVENLTNEYRPLPGFYDLYTYTGGSSTTTTPPSDFPTSAQSFAMVGTGNSGSTTSRTHYTDTWDSVPPVSTRALRWGTNKYDLLIRNTSTDYRGVMHNTQCIKMSYNRVTNKTTYEAGMGMGDSGGGVFVKVDGTWKFAGINLYREALSDGYSDIYAASIPYYASELYNILQDDLLPGDLNLDGNVDSYDYITLKTNFGMTGETVTWSLGDFNGDGLVGYEDFIALTTNFGYKSTPHPIMTPPSDGYISTGSMAMPEPGSAILLVLGAAALLRRRQGYGGQVRRRGGESKRQNQ